MNTSLIFSLVILTVASSVVSRPQCDCDRPIFGRSYVTSLSGESGSNSLPCEHRTPSFFRARTYVPVQPQPIQPQSILRYIQRAPAPMVYRTVQAQAPPRGRSYLVKEITPQHAEPAPALPVQPVHTVSVPVEAPASHQTPVHTILESVPAPAPVQTIIAEPTPEPVQTIVAEPAPVRASPPIRVVMQHYPAPPSMQTVVARPVASVPVQQRPVSVRSELKFDFVEKRGLTILGESTLFSESFSSSKSAILINDILVLFQLRFCKI